MVAFAFEAGFLFFFGIPPSLVQLDFTSVVVAMAIVVVLFASFATFLTIAAFIASGSSPFRRASAKPLVYCILFGALLSLAPEFPLKWLVLTLIVVHQVAFQFLPPLFARSSGTYMARLSAQIDAEDAAALNDNLLGRITVVNVIKLCCVAAFLMVVVFFVGKRHAQNRTRYFVTSDGNQVLVTNYGSTYLFKSFDPISRRLKGRFTIHDTSASSPLVLETALTGRLESEAIP